MVHFFQPLDKGELLQRELTVGPYIIKEKLGEGGYANVFRAVTPTGCEVALKVLKGAMEERSHVLEDFKREARIHRTFVHDNIVRCHGLERFGDQWVIAMDYFPAQTLKELDHDRSDLQATVNLLVQISGALFYLHENGYVHLDLKPGNILVNEHREVKLIDFCLAFHTGFFSKLHRKLFRKAIPGSPAYMAPEVIRGEVPDPAADLYSLGVIAYYLFTGQLPFTGTSAEDILAKQANAIPPAPTRYNPSLPMELELLLFKLLAKERKKRLNDADHFCRELLLISQKIHLNEEMMLL